MAAGLADRVGNASAAGGAIREAGVGSAAGSVGPGIAAMPVPVTAARAIHPRNAGEVGVVASLRAMSITWSRL